MPELKLSVEGTDDVALGCIEIQAESFVARGPSISSQTLEKKSHKVLNLY